MFSILYVSGKFGEKLIRIQESQNPEFDLQMMESGQNGVDIGESGVDFIEIHPNSTISTPFWI